MGSTVSVIKTLIVPAVISLLIFVLLTYILIPAWRHYRNRYSQYLPLDSLSTQTTTLRQRIAARLTSIPFPVRWRPEGSLVFASRASSDAGLDDDDDLDGEELGHVHEDTWRVMDREAQGGRADNTRRLSRDLEEGFRDDSDDEPERLVRSANIRR
ncbi:hypothetical protein B0T10DRAFT_559204 [Thelonectria olida]|uniref:Uncharacterized protein n=1 Tax=Thelonectria olida TaxID=1576542 RepID=A0A9P9ASU2_9HYPO|nr:hypothetical protein B0T10DRAFT_559204 [Thelonectria olida]